MSGADGARGAAKPIAAWISARRAGWALALIVVAGVALRVWGVAAVYQRIDDLPVAKQIYAVYQGYWSPDPLLFYPVFFNYIVGALLKLASALLTLFGRNPSPGLYEFTLDQVLLAGRLVSAAMGGLTILVVYKIGRRLFDEATALAASAFFALSFVHILYSHQIVLDVPMTLFYAASLYFCVRILQDGRWSHYLLAAFFAGIATATKYNALFVTASILLAHLWKSRETQRTILRNLTDRKIVAAGAVTILSFFAGHPYALLWFNSFVKATRELARLVHETEWYLILIKPATFLEKVWETKYVKGLWNVASAEGWILFALIGAGLFAIVRRRARGTSFIALSGLFYFLGCLGFLGFSRLRDLSTLALFYAVFAALGLAWLRRLLGRGRRGRPAFALLAVAVFAALGARSAGRVWYLAEDDTTQIAERWIRRNLPLGGTFGRELFTPEIADPAYPGLFFTRPYLIYGDFPPFSMFDVIETSSVQGGFFRRYAKYYPAQVAVYARLDDEHELLKHFYFREIEYKNPEVWLYGGKAPRRPKQRLALPAAAAPDAPAREFVMADGSPYGKDVDSLWLAGGAPVERLFLSRAKIDRLTVFVRRPEADGKIVVRSGLRRTEIPVRRGSDAFAEIAPARAFPYYAYFYKVEATASAGLPPTFVKICTDDFDAGLEYLRSGEYVRAAERFRRAEAGSGPGVRTSEAALYLAFCERQAGNAAAAEALAARFRADPAVAARFAPFRAALSGAGDWTRAFEKYAGIDVGLYETTQTVLLEDDAFACENAVEVESGTPANRKARRPAPGPGAGAFEARSPEIRLVPQPYRFELDFLDAPAKGGRIGTVEITSVADGVATTAAHPLEAAPSGSAGGRTSTCSVPFRPESFGTTVRVRLTLDPGVEAAFDRLRIVPDLKPFLLERYAAFGDLLGGRLD